MRRLQQRPLTSRRFWPVTLNFVSLAGWIILLHLIQIAAWAMLYRWRGAMPDLPTAFYFSAVTYTTTGYGDLVLPPEWRLVGGIGPHRHSHVRFVDRLLFRRRQSGIS